MSRLQRLHARLPSLLQIGLFTRGMLILYLFLYLGIGVSHLTGEIIPGSILGMLMLTMALQWKWIRIDWVELTSNLLVRWMALMFVPITVSLIDHLHLFWQALPAILLICVLGTLVILTLVGHGFQWLEQRQEGHQ